MLQLVEDPAPLATNEHLDDEDTEDLVARGIPHPLPSAGVVLFFLAACALLCVCGVSILGMSR